MHEEKNEGIEIIKLTGQPLALYVSIAVVLTLLVAFVTAVTPAVGYIEHVSNEATELVDRMTRTAVADHFTARMQQTRQVAAAAARSRSSLCTLDGALLAVGYRPAAFEVGVVESGVERCTLDLEREILFHRDHPPRYFNGTDATDEPSPVGRLASFNGQHGWASPDHTGRQAYLHVDKSGDAVWVTANIHTTFDTMGLAGIYADLMVVDEPSSLSIYPRFGPAFPEGIAVNDSGRTWRVSYRLDHSYDFHASVEAGRLTAAISLLILGVFEAVILVLLAQRFVSRPMCEVAEYFEFMIEQNNELAHDACLSPMNAAEIEHFVIPTLSTTFISELLSIHEACHRIVDALHEYRMYLPQMVITRSDHALRESRSQLALDLVTSRSGSPQMQIQTDWDSDSCSQWSRLSRSSLSKIPGGDRTDKLALSVSRQSSRTGVTGMLSLNTSQADLRVSDTTSLVAKCLVSQSALKASAAQGITHQEDLGCLMVKIDTSTLFKTEIPAKSIQDMLGSMVTLASSSIRSNRGYILANTGDLIIGHWGQARGSAREDMMDCAVEIAAKLMSDMEDFAEHRLPTLKFGIGMSYGRGFTGTVGNNKYKTFIAVGSLLQEAEVCTNAALEMGFETACTALFMSECQGYNFRAVDDVCIVGSRVRIYQVLPTSDENDYQSYRNAFACFMASEMAQATAAVSDHLAKHPDDTVGKRLACIIRICQRQEEKCTSWFRRTLSTQERHICTPTVLAPNFALSALQYKADDITFDSSDGEGDEDEEAEPKTLKKTVRIMRERQIANNIYNNVFRARRAARQSISGKDAREIREAKDNPDESMELSRAQSLENKSSSFRRVASNPLKGKISFAEEKACESEEDEDLRPVTRHQKSFVPHRRMVHTEAQEKHDQELMSKVARLNRWIALTLLLLMYNAFMVPLRFSFNYWEVHPAIVVMNFLLDASIYYVKIVLTFRTPYEDNARWIEDPKLIRRRYLHGDFCLDMLACFPLELIALAWERPLVYALYRPQYRINRVLNIVRLPRYFDSFFGYYGKNLNPIVIRIQQFLICVLYVLHFCACGFHVVLQNEEGWKTSHFPLPNYENFTGFHQYTLAFDWAVRTVSGYGHRLAVTDMQVFYTASCCVVGVAVYATVIAVITSLVTSLGAYEDQYRHKMDQLQDYIRHTRMDPALSEEILDYYRYMWKTQKTLNADESPLTGLTDELQTKINYHVNMNIMRKVPLFAAVKENDAFILDLVSNLTLSILLPDTYIFRYGDAGDAMYFIGLGRVAVLDSKDNQVAVLDEGSYFGEVALLYGTTRTASIRTLTYTHLYSLTKPQFFEIGQQYPECLVDILTTAEARLMKPDTSPSVTQQGSLLSEMSDKQKQLMLKLFMRNRKRSTGAVNPKGAWRRVWFAFKRDKERRELALDVERAPSHEKNRRLSEMSLSTRSSLPSSDCPVSRRTTLDTPSNPALSMLAVGSAAVAVADSLAVPRGSPVANSPGRVAWVEEALIQSTSSQPSL